MALRIMEHYLVLTEDIDRTRCFYIDILGLRDGFRPELGIPVTQPAEGTGCLDHIAFHGDDAEEIIARLETAGLAYERHDVPEIGLIQLFVNDPNGLKLELNFH